LATTSETAVLEKFKGQPHFSLRIMADPPAGGLSLLDARKLVESNVVSLRGWDFPHVDPRDTYNAGEYVACVTDWERHVELWRMYRSSQFVYIGNLWDISFDTQRNLMAELKRPSVLATPEQKGSIAGAISFVGLIYSITEMYMFASRLATARGVVDKVSINLMLRDIDRWALASGEPAIVWHRFYQSRIPMIDASMDMPASDLIEDFARSAIPAIQEVFQGFNWNDASTNVITQWQDRLLSGRFGF
jgi:hypothetical protein